MYSAMLRLQPDELERLVKQLRCACERHSPYALGHVWDADADAVYLVTRCFRCKRVKLTRLGDIFQWRLSFADDEIIVPVKKEYLYEQQSF